MASLLKLVGRTRPLLGAHTGRIVPNVAAAKKGFGFIQVSGRDMTQPQVFLHATELQQEQVLNRDGTPMRQIVFGECEFDIEAQEDGKERAVNVTAVGGGLLPPSPFMVRVRDGTVGEGQAQASASM